MLIVCLGTFAGGCSPTTKISQSEWNELSELEDIESVIENNWPGSITRENEETTAKNLTFKIEILEPTAIAILCTTNYGSLKMKI